MLWLFVFTIYRWRTLISKCITSQKKIILQKWSNLHKICAMCWNEWKINFPIFFNFYFFIHGWFCSQFASLFTDQKLSKKKLLSQKMRNVLKMIFGILAFFCAIFSFPVKVEFIFYLRNAFRTDELRKISMLGKSTSLSPPFLWGASPPTLSDPGYHGKSSSFQRYVCRLSTWKIEWEDRFWSEKKKLMKKKSQPPLNVTKWKIISRISGLRVSRNVYLTYDALYWKIVSENCIYDSGSYRKNYIKNHQTKTRFHWTKVWS